MDRDERAWSEVGRQRWREIVAQYNEYMKDHPPDSEDEIALSFELRDHEPFLRIKLHVEGHSYICPMGASALRASAEKFMKCADMIEQEFGIDLHFGEIKEGHYGEGDDD